MRLPEPRSQWPFCQVDSILLNIATHQLDYLISLSNNLFIYFDLARYRYKAIAQALRSSKIFKQLQAISSMSTKEILILPFLPTLVSHRFLLFAHNDTVSRHI